MNFSHIPNLNFNYRPIEKQIKKFYRNYKGDGGDKKQIKDIIITYNKIIKTKTREVCSNF